MDWNIIKQLLNLPPRSLNIALLLLGISGMIWSYKQGQGKIDELQSEIRILQKDFRHEKDSLFRAAQISEALCNERVLDGQKQLIDRLDLLNNDLNEQLGRKTNADEKRLKQANVNASIAKKNTQKLRKLNENITENASSSN